MRIKLLLAGVAVLSVLTALAAHAGKLEPALEIKTEPEICVVADPTSTPLNVRSKPYGVILGVLHNGTRVVVTDWTIIGQSPQRYRWSKIVPVEGGKAGWVFGAYLDCGLPAFLKAKERADALICSTDGPCKPLVEPPRTQLPEYMLGRWCHAPYASTEAQVVYFPPNLKTPGRKTCSDMTDGIYIDKGGYDDESPVDDAPACLFDNIKQKDRDTYLVHVNCKEGNKPSFEGNEEFQLINGLLFKKRMPEG